MSFSILLERTLVLPEELREELKKPFGNLFSSLGEALEELNIETLICVGDVISVEALVLGLKPKLCIYDAKVMRRRTKIAKELLSFKAEEVVVSNEAGRVEKDASRAVKACLERPGNFKLRVEGEEDLLAIPAMAFAPQGSFLAYGQPGQGVVVVEIDEAVKAKLEVIVERMSPNEGSGADREHSPAGA